MRRVRVASLGVLLAAPMGLQAGDHWLSGVTIKTPGQPEMMISASRAAVVGLASVMQASSTAVFDITISLDSNPQGDDNYRVKDGANDAEQRAYEERIEEFARAVYQSTNGAHKIGRVTIFREGAQTNRVDVIWYENCPDRNKGPRADPSGFGKAGKRIWMCTNWSGSSLMPDPKGSGYTLAHEWGHYAYGVYDEYAKDCRSGNLSHFLHWNRFVPEVSHGRRIPHPFPQS
jgi:calcium-activated chloride channel regulator 3/4